MKGRLAASRGGRRRSVESCATSLALLCGLALGAASLFSEPRHAVPSSDTRPVALRNAASARPCASHHWVTNWYAAPGDATLGLPPVEQTYRIQVRPSRTGSVARFRFSNRFGNASVTFGSATVGKQATVGTPTISRGTLHQLLFDGRSQVTVPEGAEVYSDPAPIRIRSFRRLLVSIHVVGSPGPATQHGLAEQTTWGTLPGSGDHTRQLTPRGFMPTPVPGLNPAIPQAIPYLVGMEVREPFRVGTVVAFGDSITDGAQSSPVPLLISPKNIDRFASYPDQLANRIRSEGLAFTVANAGISGNQLLRGALVPIMGPSGLSRFQQDALTLPGVATVIVLEGINDIGQSFATRDELVAGYRKLVSAAHQKGIRILLGTMTPQAGTIQPPGYGTMAEPTRLAANEWIRSQDISDGIVDFDKAVRDPVRPSRILPAYDGGDHLHFNAAGYRAMARAVPLGLLRGFRCN